MKDSVYYAQITPTTMAMPIPIRDSIIPVLLPGVVAVSDGTIVRVDVHLLLEAASTSSGLSLDYLIILLRNEDYLCSRHFCHTNSHGTESDVLSLPLSFSFIDIPPSGKVTYSLKLIATPEATMKAKSVLLQDCSLLATVSEPSTHPLPKDAVLVSNWKMASLFLCTPKQFERLIPTGQIITGGVWLPDGSAFYGVEVSGFSNMIRLDATTSRITNLLPQGTYGEPLVSKDGRYVYVTDDSSVIQIDTKSQDTKRMTFSKQEHPPYIALHPDGSRMFVGLQDSGIAVVNTVNMNSLGTYPVKERKRLSITEDGSVLVAAGKEIVFVSLATGTRKRVGELNSPVAASALSSRFGFLCVVDVNKHLHFADLKTRNLLSVITLPFSPMRFLYIDDKRGRVYVPMWDDKSLTSYLSVVDLTKRSLIATVSLRPGLLGMLCVEGDQVWVSMLDRILLLDPDTLEYQDEIHTGMYPFSLHFRPSISINKSN